MGISYIKKGERKRALPLKRVILIGIMNGKFIQDKVLTNLH